MIFCQVSGQDRELWVGSPLESKRPASPNSATASFCCSYCSHEIKRRLLPGRKVMTNLDSILKSRDITLPTKVFQWSCMDVRVGLWRKLIAEELMLLNCGVGEDSGESLGPQGDPTSPEISPGCSLEGLMPKLKLQYFGHLMWRVDSLEKTLMLGGTGNRRRRGWQRIR